MQKIDEWLSYLDRVRNLQHEFEGFLSFTPVPFKHFQSNFNKSDIAHDLKIMSLSRIFLTNIPFIQAPISRHGISLSQVALSFGANAIRGRISDKPNSRFVRCNDLKTINRAEMTSLIKKALREPKESNAFFQYDRDSNFNYEDYKNLNRRLSLLLYKSQHDEVLDNKEFLDLAEKAPLLQLGLSTKSLKKRHQHQNSLLVFSDKKVVPGHQKVFGITELLEGDLASNIVHRIDTDVDIVIPNHKDKFGILTDTEISDLHRQLAHKNFASMGKLSLPQRFTVMVNLFGNYFLKS